MCTSAWGLTTLTLQAWLIPIYKPTTKSIRSEVSGSQEKPGVYSWLELLSLCCTTNFVPSQPAWLGSGQGKVVLGRSRRWREQRRVLQAARDGLILPCSRPDTVALVTARVNQWCRLKLKELEMSPGVWKPEGGDFSGVEFESRKKAAQSWQQVFWKWPSKFHLYNVWEWW